MDQTLNSKDEPSSSVPSGRRFKGKTVLVTGGGKGIGLATTLKFASEGARVVVVK